MNFIAELKRRNVIRMAGLYSPASVDTISPIRQQVVLNDLLAVLGLMLQHSKALMNQFPHRRA